MTVKRTLIIMIPIFKCFEFCLPAEALAMAGILSCSKSTLDETKGFKKSLDVYAYPIILNPVYLCSAFGMRMPSGVWLFSKRAATIRGSASEEPFRVCASWIRLSASR